MKLQNMSNIFEKLSRLSKIWETDNKETNKYYRLESLKKKM